MTRLRDLLFSLGFYTAPVALTVLIVAAIALAGNW